jgi:Bacterial Ig-like domain (group 3)
MLPKLLSKVRPALVGALSLLATAALAQTIQVGPGQPYTTIQSGINAAVDGDIVLVAPGTYNENINFNGKAITVVSSTGAASTIIQGDGSAPVVTFGSAEGRSSVLNGFTIQGVSNPTLSQYAPGVLIGSAPTILNNIITNNPCNGIDVDFGGPLIQGNVISNTNSTGGNGSCGSFTGSAIVLGGYYPQASVVIGNTIIHNQHAIDYDGGGLLMWAAENAVIESNLFTNNATPTGEGGAIATFNSDAMIIAQNLFYANVAQYGGGAIALHPPDATQGPFIGLIQNNTFVGNSSVSSTDEYGEPAASQVYLDANLAQYEFTDNIVVGADSNAALVCGPDYNYLSITPLVIDHDDIYNSAGPGYGGVCPDQTGQYGNISADPLFKDVAGNDYHLLAGSAAIDTGNNSALQLLANAGAPITTDLDGNPRVQDATGKGYPVIDMGVYEYPGNHTASPTTAVLNPSAYYVNGGQSFTLTANMYSPLGTPTGTVTFFEDGNQIGTATIDGTGAAVLTLGSGLVPGTHAFLATYPGQGNFTPCESVKIYVIVDAYGVTLDLTSAPNPSLTGQSVIFQIKISSANGVPTGNITLTDNSTGTTLATLTPDANGSASFSISTLAVGTPLIEASYLGNSNYSSASASVVQVVEGGSTTSTTLTCSPNPIQISGTAQFVATVSSGNGTPTGSISFTDNGAALATQGLVNGTTNLTYTGAAAGTHSIIATYVPTGSFAASSATCSEVVNALPTTSTLTVAPAMTTYGTPVTLTATVTPLTPPGPSTPTGVVTFYNGATVIGSGTLAGGVATLVDGFLAGGSYNLTCTYGGNSIYAMSNCNSVPVTVNAAPSSLTLSSSANPAIYSSFVTFTIRLTANGQSAGTGNTIQLSINGQVIDLTTDATGSATYTIDTLVPNSYPIIASFTGTNNLQASSASLTEVITAAPTSNVLTAAPNPGDLNQPVTLTATVSSPSNSTLIGSGNVAFYDGTTLLGSAPVEAHTPMITGSVTASLTVSFSTLGIHNLTAVYDGDADYLTSTSAVYAETIVAGDFSISATPGTASVYTGESAAIEVSVASLQGFNQPLALTCSGLPANATCSLSPASLPNGQGGAKLVIQTAAPHEAEAASVSVSAFVFGAFTLLLLPGWRRRRGLLVGLSPLLLAACAVIAMAGCGAQNQVTGGTPPGTYQVAVTAATAGTGTTLAHSAVVTLTVKSLF